MVKIVISDEQARAIAQSKERIEIVDAAGNRIGFLARPFSEEDIAIASRRRRSGEERRSTAQVLERLKSMDQG